MSDEYDLKKQMEVVHKLEGYAFTMDGTSKSGRIRMIRPDLDMVVHILPYVLDRWSYVPVRFYQTTDVNGIHPRFYSERCESVNGMGGIKDLAYYIKWRDVYLERKQFERDNYKVSGKPVYYPAGHRHHSYGLICQVSPSYITGEEAMKGLGELIEYEKYITKRIAESKAYMSGIVTKYMNEELK